VLARFLIYGLLGWCLEVVFTGLAAALQKDRSATATTYLWMFPIYGGAALGLEQAQAALGDLFWLTRAVVYVAIIYCAELSAGWLLRRALGRCPWDYTGRGVHLAGLIRLDYAPAWLAVALLFEPAHGAVARMAEVLAV